MQLDTSTITREAVRSELAALSSDEVILAMAEKGWAYDGGLRRYSDSESGYFTARFETWEWGGVPLGRGLGSGFSLAVDEAHQDPTAMTWTVRRAAEVCLQMAEIFTEYVPATSDIHGIIRPDMAMFQQSWQASRLKFSDPVFIDEREERKRHRIFGRDFLFEENGFYHLVAEHREILLDEESFERLEEQVGLMRARKCGKLAM